MKEITDGQKDLAFALGEQARQQGESITDNPFKKNKEHFYWWRIGFESREK
jgi:hypothetical protein